MIMKHDLFNLPIRKFLIENALNKLWMRLYCMIRGHCLSVKLEISGLWEPVNSHHHLYHSYLNLEGISYTNLEVLKCLFHQKKLYKMVLIRNADFGTWLWLIEFRLDLKDRVFRHTIYWKLIFGFLFIGFGWKWMWSGDDNSYHRLLQTVINHSIKCVRMKLEFSFRNDQP